MAPPTILETLGRAFTGGRIGMALVDLDGRWLEVNPALCRMLGRPADELLGRSLDEVTQPDDRGVSRLCMAALVAGGDENPTTFETRYVRADGSTLWVRVTSSVAFDDDGGPQAIFSQFEDITDHRVAEQQLRESHEAFWRAFEEAPVGMTLNSPDAADRGRVVRANAAASTLLRRTRDELVGMTLQELTHPDDLGLSVGAWSDLLAGKRQSVTNELRLRRGDGSWLWVSSTTSMFRVDSGRPVYVLSHIRDVTARRQADRQLREAEQRFRSAFDHASVGMAVLSVDGRVLRANAALREMVGYDEDEMSLVASVDPDDLEEGRRLAREVLRGVASRYTHQPRMTRADGRVLRTRVTGSVVRDADDRPLYLVVQVEDITAARIAEEAAQLRLAQQTAVAWLGQQALDEPDVDALLEAAVAIATATLGVPLGSFLRVAADGDTVEAAAQIGWEMPDYTFSLRKTGGMTAAVLAGAGPVVVDDVESETRFSTESLRAHDIASCLSIPVAGEDDAVYGALTMSSSERRAFTIDDIAFVTSLANVITGAVRRAAAARRLRHQSLHDPLTQLPNRTLLLDRLRHGIARARRDGTTLAVLFCDLDDFKYVNDSLGHDAGDRVLSTLATRLTEALRDADTLARFGGDEFVVLCEGLRDAAEAAQVAGRLMEVCDRPIDLDEIEYVPTTSIGIAIAPPGSEPDPEGLLRDADVAMYGAKERGKGRYEVFDSRMRARTTTRITLTGDLRRAIAKGELELHYQPIVSLRRHEVAALEALVRWRHPVRGLLMPAEFVGLAEDNGLIHELGRWVVDEAIRSAALWRRHGTPVLEGVTVGVNVSWRQLAQGTLVEDVRAALDRHRLEGAAFCAEVTETALMEEPRRARTALADMRAMGVQLGLDDFGTGHSSLSVLRDFDLDVIKLDRSFLASPGEWAIIRAVREMASSLDLLIVAEGVERDDQAARVEEIGCDFGQGWLYGHAMPAAALPARVAKLAERFGARR